MNIAKRLISASLAAILVLPVTGCEFIDKIKAEFTSVQPAVTGGAGEGEQEVSNSISVGIFDFDTFNPLITKSQTVKECMEFVYEPLFDVDEKIQPVPVLAESYSVSPDGRIININLKNNVLWHDGSGFTAYDAAYTIKQIRSGATTYSDALKNMADYQATGDYSLQIVLNYAVPNFVSLLTFPIVKLQTDMRPNVNYVPVGTGAFRYETQLSTGRLSFIAFENYRGGKAKINNVYVYTAPDLKKYESMFEANEIDLMTGKTVDLSEYTPRGSATNNEYITNKLTFAGYNTANKLLKNSETRRGLTELIDKESIVNSTIYSRGVACDIPLNPSSLYYYDTNTRFKADTMLAINHLGNDNWGLGHSGKYERIENGEKQVLELSILTDSDSVEKVSIANKIAASFNEFGIPATVTALPYAEYMQKISAGDYEMMIGETEIGANLDLSILTSSAGNYFSYSNQNVDMLAAQMGMTQNEEELKSLYRQYGDVLLEDMPFTALFFRKGDIMSSSKIKSEVVPSLARGYRNVEMWSVTE